MMMGKGEAIYKKAISNRHNRMIRYGRNIETKKKQDIKIVKTDRFIKEDCINGNPCWLLIEMKRQ